MKKAIAVMMLLGGGLFAAPRVTLGIGIGAPAPVAVVQPACPGPGYTWVNGYYGTTGVYVNGYWAPPVVERVAPRVDYDHFRDGRRDFVRHDVVRHDDHFRR